MNTFLGGRFLASALLSAFVLTVPADLGPLPDVIITQVDRGYVSPVGDVVVLNYFNPPPRPWDGGFHRGVDLFAGAGADVFAPGPGVVTFAGSAFGKPTVTIVHPDGLSSSLEPVVTVRLEEVIEDEPPAPPLKPGLVAQPEPPREPHFIEVPIIRVGDTVSAGTPIGLVGYWPADSGSNSSHCPGTTCVHWGVRRSEDNYLDPLWLLNLAAPIVLLPIN